MITLFAGIIAVASSTWVCEVKDPTWPYEQKNRVYISLDGPEVKLSQYVPPTAYDPEGNELTTLIDSSTVSTWKVPRVSCQISEKKEPASRYRFDFHCDGIEGFFQMNFEAKTAIYHQLMTNFNAHRTIATENCREL